ncbi:MAG TPA: hypothetical protein VFZ16_00695, partial [Hyphomicrobiaceae bacterium]|nr:hypothetical protein [Hyphomicrobiaceae bacterium]
AFGYLPAHPIHAFAGGLGLAPAAALSYARARHVWSLRMARARAQEKAWRSAAFVIEGAQLTGFWEFAGPERSTVPASLALSRSHGLMQEGEPW